MHSSVDFRVIFMHDMSVTFSNSTLEHHVLSLKFQISIPFLNISNLLYKFRTMYLCSSVGVRVLVFVMDSRDYIESEHALRDRVSWCSNTYDNKVWVEVRDMIRTPRTLAI